MSTGDTFLFFFMALGCEVLGTIGGFGSSLFFVPLAGFFFDFHTVLGITALLHVSSNLSKMGLFVGGFSKKIVVAMGLPALAGTLAGAFLSGTIHSEYLEWILSAFLILLSVFLLLSKTFRLKDSFPVLAGGGIVSGFMAGLLGTGGAVRGVVLSSMGLGSEAFIATSALIDVGIDTSRLGIYIYNGFVGNESWKLLPMLFVCGFVGSWIGKKIVQHIPETYFRTLVLFLVMATGISALFKKIL